MVPRGFQEALERFLKNQLKKALARGLPDSPPRVRGFEQSKTIIEQETAVAAIVVAVVDVVADFVASVFVVVVVVVAIVAIVVVAVVFLLLRFFFFYVARF